MRSGTVRNDPNCVTGELRRRRPKHLRGSGKCVDGLTRRCLRLTEYGTGGGRTLRSPIGVTEVLFQV